MNYPPTQHDDQQRVTKHKTDKIRRLHAFSNWCWKHHLTPIAKFTRLFIRIIFSADIPYQLTIGKGTVFPHCALGSLFHPAVTIGERCVILHGVTAGGKPEGVPTIENDVRIGAHATIVGKITIGHHSVIGAGSVVVKDVPPYSIVAGNPAKIIRTIEH